MMRSELPTIPSPAETKIALCAAELGYSMMKSARFGMCQNCSDSGKPAVSMEPKLVRPMITITAVIISRLLSKLRKIKALYAAEAIKKAKSEKRVEESGSKSGKR